MTERTLKDIVVTTPKKLSDIAIQEAQNCRELIEAGKEAFYFRTFWPAPKHLSEGSRIYYVEDGYVRGFGTVNRTFEGYMTCETTGKNYGFGFHAFIPADSWQWIKPIEMKGFQGFRYFRINRSEVQVVGNWLDSKPNVEDYV